MKVVKKDERSSTGRDEEEREEANMARRTKRKRAKGTRSGRARRSLAGGTMAENCRAKSTRDKGSRAGRRVKIADLHKTPGVSSAIVLSTSHEEDVRRCRDAPKGRAAMR